MNFAKYIVGLVLGAIVLGLIADHFWIPPTSRIISGVMGFAWGIVYSAWATKHWDLQ